MNPSELSSQRGLSDRTKRILATIGIVGIIIVGALLIYSILIGPSREPYRSALTQYENVGRANNALTAAGSALNASTATDQAFESSIKTAQAALTSLKTENTALGKEAVLKTGEGKALYDAFNKKLQVYMTYNKTVLDSMLKVRPALYGCSQKMSSVSENEAGVEAIKSCQSGLEQLSGISDSDYQALVTAFVEDYGALAATFEQIVALKDPKGADAAQYQVLVNQRTQNLSDLSDDSTSFTKSVQAHRQEVLTTDTASKLHTYLNDKSRIF